MQRSPDGELVSCTMYYDPVIEHNNPGGTTMGLGIAFYLLPYESDVAREMFEAWVSEMDLRNPAVAVTPKMVGTNGLGKLGLILAQEFGDVAVASSKHTSNPYHTSTTRNVADRLLVSTELRTVLEIMVEGKEFGDGEFGFFSHLGEEWPRGQSSALYICSEVMSPGAWHRAFNAEDWKARFSEPTVSGVDFPTVGIAAAWNDLKTGELTVKTAAAAPSKEGDSTSFKLTTLDECNLGALTAICDGEAFTDFTISDGEVTVDTTVASHSFVFSLGFHGSAGGTGGARL